MARREWKFVYDEEVCDTQDIDFVGIITDGKRFLFFQTVTDEEQNEERCYIYSSMRAMYNCDSEELSYPWTNENDELLLKALNSLDDDSDRYCGENSIFHEFFADT